MPDAQQGPRPEANPLITNKQIVQKWVRDQGLPRSISVHIALSPEGEEMLNGYLAKIQASQKEDRLSSTIGVRLARVLGDQNLKDFTPHDLIDALLKTKNMLLYAGDIDHFPAPVQGEQSLWTKEEYRLLAEMTPYVGDVTAYSGATFVSFEQKTKGFGYLSLGALTLGPVIYYILNVVSLASLSQLNLGLLGLGAVLFLGGLFAIGCGVIKLLNTWSNLDHESAFARYIERFDDPVNQEMLFLCPNGVMLGGAGADLPEHCGVKGKVDRAYLKAKLAQRILPGLLLANSKATEDGFIYATPKLGAVEFAGPYKKLVNGCFEGILKEIISENIECGKLNQLRGVVLASDRESEPEPIMPEGPGSKVLFRTLPWNATDDQLGLFSTPKSLFPDVEGGTQQILHAVATAADPLSWVGNTRYFGGSQTAEGGMAACCDVLFRFIFDKTPPVDVVKAIHRNGVVGCLEGYSLQLESVFITGEEDPGVRLNGTNNVIDCHGEPRPWYNPTWVSDQQSALHSKAEPQASEDASSKARPAAASALAATGPDAQVQPSTAHEAVSTTQQRTGPSV